MDVCKAFIIYLLQSYDLKFDDLSKRDQDILLSMVLANTTMDINAYIQNYLCFPYKVK